MLLKLSVQYDIYFHFIVISDVELMMFKIKKEKEKPSCYGLTFYFEIFVAITTATCFSLK
jgi:hypothetical protein